ncbi:MAG: diphosphomevalonate decarboxylase [Candidatus Pacebacteria bacterium RIFOXYB1_FULL_39_46]|nr:MAG: diphosphomevalonate decarboxylase [Candidatus Pacebacteria bacterium RIFOXYA1_FULL_38_18]OGJ38087.1 MAG: diphosphomevalonate decarboxylase [Candidatus Pacebacteria bacterium RIFOXYB1_FULL_39_46]OGJ39690.1 MAG: diphosphomevalonate decarboxylase [Candidatus Pacebacteria bacterium RIFOXYC1_FULL_39_21]OGJ39839.1 MAG: diphosphomevalonate decarboxylase [Candidatus Pacebacteria bacterium RIFOXYD1_FULL_39_27]
MKKQTVLAHSDVALIKYWGKKDVATQLPENSSVSVALNGLDTITTVEFDDKLLADDIVIQGSREAKEVERVVLHLERIRNLAQIKTYAKVVSKNTFPKATGLSSSGSGFAALTLAAIGALELKLSPKEISILARKASGTACRCVMGGFIKWLAGDTSSSSYSKTIFDENYWDIRDVIAIVDFDKKKVSSSEGHLSAHSSPFYQVRLQRIPSKIKKIKQYINDKDFSSFGKLIESEALEFHSILLTSKPPLIAWYPGTIAVMNLVQEMRKQGIEAYFTINTGFNVHILTLPQFVDEVQKRVSSLSFVRDVMKATVGGFPQKLDTHLF